MMSGRGLLCIAAVLTLPGCAARVVRFQAAPSHVCAGTPVTLTVETVGSPAVSTAPPLAEGPGRTYRPAVTTRFFLTVSRFLGKKARSETEVRVMPGSPGEADEITANVVCAGGRISGTVQRDPAAWDPRLRVAAVESGEDRDVEVVHEGRSATLTPQQPTTSAFEGTSPGGAWTLSSALRAGESCGSSPPVADILNLSAGVRCRD
jgi:hypothetical protein